MESKLQKIVMSPPDGVLAFSGLFRNHLNLVSKVAGIMNLTASTVRSHHTRKIQIGTVPQATQLGLDAVAVHVNLSSKYESEMLQILGSISHDCVAYGMPLLAIVYPRSETDAGDNNYEDLKSTNRDRYKQLVAHCARLGAELGADIVKTQYTGDVDSFRFVVEACRPVPVIVAGGPLLPVETLLRMAYEVICAGGAGVSFGRNVFGRADPVPLLRALKAIVHEGATGDEALYQYRLASGTEPTL